jgi:ribulose-phosphate 3-epimerase
MAQMAFSSRDFVPDNLRPMPVLPAPPDTPAVCPSLMSADALNLGAQVTALMDAGARVFHVDVMDGRFVPNLMLGTETTRGVASITRPRGAMVDVHLMVERPGDAIGWFAPHADMISVHLEADPHPHQMLTEIRAAGCLAGLAINPGTPLEAVTPLIPRLDYVNCMGVNPGFSGQSFIPETLRRLTALREVLPVRVALQVDGGVGLRNIADARAAGADLLVSASALFGADDPIAAYGDLVAGVASA